jgi:DNA-binding NarL/FixJ family response regulator
MPQLRIFIGDTNRNGRLGIEMLIDNEPGFQVVGIAVRAEGLVSQVRACQPDIVLLEWHLVRLSPVSIFKEVHALESQPQIIIMDVNVETRQLAIACGADAFFGKDFPGDQLLPALQRLR